MRTRSRRLGAVTTMLAICVTLLGPWPGAAQDAPRLELLTWNVKLLDPLTSLGFKARKRMKKRAASMGLVVAGKRPDLVGINEGFVKKPVRILAAAAATEAGLSAVGLRQPDRSGDKVTNGGLGMLAGKSLRLIEFDARIWEDCWNIPTVDCPAAKGVFYARLELPKPDLRVSVFVVHLNAGATEKSRATRRKQLAQLRAFVDAKAGTGQRYPTFIMGDFNITGECSGCDVHLESLDLVQALKLDSLGTPVDTYLEQCPMADCADIYDGGATHPGKDRGEKKRLDYILYYPTTGQWQTRYVTASYAVQPMVTTPGHEQKTGPGSDHYAVTAAYTFHSSAVRP